VLFFSKTKLLRLQGFSLSLLAELRLKGKFDFLGFLLDNNLFHIVVCCDLGALVTFWGANYLTSKIRA
jgi:hypothetical protein